MSISNSLKDVLSEVKGFLKGKTLDAMIPPLIFVLMNRWLPLPLVSFLALAFAILVTSHRLLAKKDWRYALAGLVGVVIAIGFVFISGSAKSYFLPALINTIILFVAALISLIMKKPLAAWLSHLSRGWTLSWFWRFDIRPAYTEVTLLWAITLLIRAFLQWRLLLSNNPLTIGIFNTILGTPATISILIISYLYGIWRLKQLKGPSIDEYDRKDPAPWRGQTKGF